jgi:dolichol-phosphate mannosyltransferase
LFIGRGSQRLRANLLTGLGTAVIRRAAKDGLVRAYAAGFDVAQAIEAEIICQIDCDFSHDPNDLPRLVERVAGGADAAIRSR